MSGLNSRAILAALVLAVLALIVLAPALLGKRLYSTGVIFQPVASLAVNVM